MPLHIPSIYILFPSDTLCLGHMNLVYGCFIELAVLSLISTILPFDLYIPIANGRRAFLIAIETLAFLLLVVSPFVNSYVRLFHQEMIIYLFISYGGSD